MTCRLKKVIKIIGCTKCVNYEIITNLHANCSSETDDDETDDDDDYYDY